MNTGASEHVSDWNASRVLPPTGADRREGDRAGRFVPFRGHTAERPADDHVGARKPFDPVDGEGAMILVSRDMAPEVVLIGRGRVSAEPGGQDGLIQTGAREPQRHAVIAGEEAYELESGHALMLPEFRSQ